MSSVSTAPNRIIADELTALHATFRELLGTRRSLAQRREQTKRFRSADRPLRKAHSAVQRQLQDVAVELHLMGVSPIEISRIMRDSDSGTRS